MKRLFPSSHYSIHLKKIYGPGCLYTFRLKSFSKTLYTQAATIQLMSLKKTIMKLALSNALKYNSEADLKAVIGKVFASEPELRKKGREIVSQIYLAVKEVNKLSLEEQKNRLQKLDPSLLEEKKVEKKEKKLRDLKNVGKKIVMRFEPSPSGSLHIGHAYSLLLNSEYCKKYKGELILRIADTNPSNSYADSYKLIEEDANWITNNKISRVVIQSDRLENYYSQCLILLDQGNAYVCDCDSEEASQMIKKGIGCPCRDLPNKKQLERWRSMFTTYHSNEAVVRLKTYLKHKNPAMRDFPIFRINSFEHPRQGKKYRVWPLMNFSVAVDDYELGLTHVIRGKDHYDNTKRQKYIFDYLKWNTPEYIHVGRINFDGLNLSASETRKLIEEGKFTGWDDIRLPFLQALKKRGFTPEAFIKFTIETGVTLVDKRVESHKFFKMIEAFNRSIIESDANRYFFVAEPQKINIKKAPEQTVKLELHPTFPKRGSRSFKTSNEFYIAEEDKKKLKQNKLYRLMNCLNFKKVKQGFEFTSTDKEDYQKKGDGIMHWLPTDKIIEVEVSMPDGKIVKGFGEQSLSKLKLESVIQFERFGFVKMNSKEKNVLQFWFTHK